MILPKHVAIIMDGNGRWGIQKKKSRNYGHSKGIEVVENIIEEAVSKKIKFEEFTSNENLILVHDINLQKEKTKLMEVKGIKTIGVSILEDGYINLDELFKKLANLGLTRVLVEGGGKLATSLIKSKLVDKLILFTAGIILDKNCIILEGFGNFGYEKSFENLYMPYKSFKNLHVL